MQPEGSIPEGSIMWPVAHVATNSRRPDTAKCDVFEIWMEQVNAIESQLADVCFVSCICANDTLIL